MAPAPGLKVNLSSPNPRSRIGKKAVILPLKIVDHIMLNDPSKEAENEPIEVRCYFVRERNALLVRGDFSPLYTDYYLHLMQHGIKHERAQDDLLKDGLAALTLHLSSRPRNEAAAWTLSWQDPLQNLFVTGSNRSGNVVGRVFTEDVRERDTNLFIAQVMVAGQESRQSMIKAETLDMFKVAEAFYHQSEQRPGRYFRNSEEDFVMVSAQPDCDLAWLEALDDEGILAIDEAEMLSLLETRVFRFDCGCSPGRIFPIIAGMTEEALEVVFGEGEVLAAGCPRCAARYVITRESLEAFKRERASS